MKAIGWIKRTTLIGLVAALALAAMPWTGVYAAGAQDPSTPPAGGELRGDRLERAWARLQKAYDRQGRMLDMSGKLIERVQSLVDKAEADGKDVSALEAALDAFEAAVEQAQTVHEQGGAIIAAHTGFDDAGKVTDPELAAETVRELAEGLKQVRELLARPGRALQDALKDFREANPPPAERPTE